MSSHCLCLIIAFCALSGVIEANSQIRFQPINTTVTDCRRPPSFKGGVRECCRISLENIWGDLTIAYQACGRKVRYHFRSPLDSIRKITTVSPDRNDSTSVADSQGDETTTQPVPKIISEKPTHGRRYRKNRRGHKECFMECVFNEEGFLANNKIDKETVLNTLKSNVGDNEDWRNVALVAAEICLQRHDVANTTNSLCPSGSYDVFQCVFKEIFYNCPSWVDDEHCNSLKKHYEKCPESPPPSVDEKIPVFVNGENGTDGE